jgi:hypothetical protein
LLSLDLCYIEDFWFRKYFRSDVRKVFEKIRRNSRRKKIKSVYPSTKKDSVVFGWILVKIKSF